MDWNLEAPLTIGVWAARLQGLGVAVAPLMHLMINVC